jgi:hypothetical protein
MDWFHWERSQGRATRHGLEVACLPSWMGSPLGWSDERDTPSLSKFVRSVSFWAGRVAVYAVSGALSTPVFQAITSDIWNPHPTDEVPRRPGPSGQVAPAYKSDTKGRRYAPVTGTASLRPRLQGYRQRQSRGARARQSGRVCSERQNLRGPQGLVWFMDPVSPVIAATTWPGRTSSCQPAGSLSNRSQQPDREPVAVRSR